MPDFNQSVLVGRLTADAELKYTTSGTAYCKFSLAVTTRFGGEGEKKEETSFIPITIWGKTAEVAAKLKKGAPALVSGRIKISKYETNEGEKRTSFEVTADRFQFLAPKPKGEENAKEESGAW